MKSLTKAISGVILFSVSIAFLFLMATPSEAPAPPDVIVGNFSVTWHGCVHDITTHSCLVDIQNLNDSYSHGFNLSAVVSNTNYDLNAYTTTAIMYEWKALNTTFPTYDTRIVNETHYNVTYDNITNETLSNETYYIVYPTFTLGYDNSQKHS